MGITTSEYRNNMESAAKVVISVDLAKPIEVVGALLQEF